MSQKVKLNEANMIMIKDQINKQINKDLKVRTRIKIGSSEKNMITIDIFYINTRIFINKKTNHFVNFMIFF